MGLSFWPSRLGPCRSYSTRADRDWVGFAFHHDLLMSESVRALTCVHLVGADAGASGRGSPLLKEQHSRFPSYAMLVVGSSSTR